MRFQKLAKLNEKKRKRERLVITFRLPGCERIWEIGVAWCAVSAQIFQNRRLANLNYRFSATTSTTQSITRSQCTLPSKIQSPHMCYNLPGAISSNGPKVQVLLRFARFAVASPKFGSQSLYFLFICIFFFSILPIGRAVRGCQIYKNKPVLLQLKLFDGRSFEASKLRVRITLLPCSNIFCQTLRELS